MLDKISFKNVLFLDIETAPIVYEYAELSDEMKGLWDRKMQYSIRENKSGEELYKKAGVFAEFAKIVCIAIGYLERPAEKPSIRIKSFLDKDEGILLCEFKAYLEGLEKNKNLVLCAHNGKEFDFPFIARRMLINGIVLPELLNHAGKKPWEINHLDTLELWKFGDYKNYTSLSLLAAIFSIPTPKDDIDGSQVAQVYWEEKNLNRIVTYCQKDVLTVAQLLLKFKGEKLIDPSNVFVDDSVLLL